MSRYLFRALSIVFLLSAPAFAQEPQISKQSQVTLVLWTANDCVYCTRWKGSMGGKGDLMRWPGFAQIEYLEIERPSLRGSFSPEHFASSQGWLRDDSLASRRASSAVPAWSIYVDQVHVVTAVGLRNWERIIFPKLRDLAQNKVRPES